MKAIVLLGAPGAGKGVQAALLKASLGVPHVSTGEMLRERIRQGASPEAVAGAVQSGELVTDEVVNRMVEERLSRSDAANGFILDGYPRTVAQAEHLRDWLERRGGREVVVHLVVDYNIVIKRLTGRRQCPRCGTLYNVFFRPPLVEGVCDLDGEKLAIRGDDNELVIRERLDAYDRQTRPVLDYYRSAGIRVIDVDAGAASPEGVFGEISQAMK